MARRRKILASVISLALVGSMLSGCASKPAATPAPTPEPAATATPAPTAAPAKEKVLRFNLNGEPKTIDPGVNNETVGSAVIRNTFEGLTRLDESDKPYLAAAESYEMSPDGTKYTFKLRSGQKWSNGAPLTAKDFEYAWKRVLTPETASPYAYQLYYIKNAEEYNSGKAGIDDVAVKAVDDLTLEVELIAPLAYFLDLLAYYTYYPVYKDAVEKDGKPNVEWVKTGDTYVCNGPFMLQEWKPKDKIVVVKNPNYRLAENTKLDRIDFSMISDTNSGLAAFNSGNVDALDSGGIPAAEIPKMLANGTAKAAPYLGTYYFALNVSDNEKADPAVNKILKDPRVRQALNLAINREELVTNISQGGERPAGSFVYPDILDSKGNSFLVKNYFDPKGDVEAAKKLLAEAGYPDGKGIPAIKISYDTRSFHKEMVQAVQDMWRKNLNVDSELLGSEWAVFQTIRKQRDYTVARHGWIGDYLDPYTFLSLFISNVGNNDPGYNNPAYDKILADAQKEVDPVKRYEMLHQAEDMLMADMPVIPIFFYTSVYAVKDNVIGFNRTRLGHMYFDTVDIK